MPLNYARKRTRKMDLAFLRASGNTKAPSHPNSFILWLYFEVTLVREPIRVKK